MTFETWLALACALIISVMMLGRSLGGGWRAALPTMAGVALGQAVRRISVRRSFNRAGGAMLVGAGLATAAMRRS
jgi:hypothetical protein